MVLKAKLLAALAALLSLECTSMIQPGPGESSSAVVVRPAPGRRLMELPLLPPMPAVRETRPWERGMRTGIQTSNARSAYLVMLRDTGSTSGRILAYGWDPKGRTNLFVFSLAPADARAFQGQWSIDIGDWKEAAGSIPG